jgi:Holliday junction DNA helicase RuvA
VIGILRGRLLEKRPPELIVDVQGVGYELSAPMTTFYDLPAISSEITLYTHLAVRDDAHTLYGFMRASDRDLFRNLIRVNGVGAKLALTILSGMSADLFVDCVQAQDTAALVRLPGVGKKTAERLVIELRDRLKTWEGAEVAVSRANGNNRKAIESPVEEAVSALVALGYKPQDASRMVRGIDTAELVSEEIIRQALQEAVR